MPRRCTRYCGLAYLHIANIHTTHQHCNSSHLPFKVGKISSQLSEECLKIPPLQRPHPEDPKEVLKHFLFNEDRKNMERNKEGLHQLWRTRGNWRPWRVESRRLRAGADSNSLLSYSLSLHHPSHPTCVCRATDANGDSQTTSSSSSSSSSLKPCFDGAPIIHLQISTIFYFICKFCLSSVNIDLSTVTL